MIDESRCPTIARPITASGRGAVATIRINGELSQLGSLSQFQSASGWKLSELPINRLCFGQWGRDLTEDIVACRTDVDSLELHCHGGPHAVERLLTDLRQAGLSIDADEANSRSHHTLREECSFALRQATTLRAAGWIQFQLRTWQRMIEELSQQIANHEWAAARERVRSSLAWSQFGRHLTQPWSITLLGRPNVGKSSLMNQLVGFERSIVFDQPGTTRDVVIANTVLNGWAIQLSDTAGQHDAAQGLEAEGIQRACRTIAAADLRIVVLDVNQPPEPGDRRLLAEWPDSLIVFNKSDLRNAWTPGERPDAVSVSCITKSGLNDLSREVVRRLVPRQPSRSEAIPLTERQDQRLQELDAALKDQRLDFAIACCQRLLAE